MSRPRIVVDHSGFTAIFGVDHIVEEMCPAPPPSPRNPWHITLLTKDESRQLKDQGVASPFLPSTKIEDLVPLGLGGIRSQGVEFIVVISNSLNRLRKKAGLPWKDFHISLVTPKHASPNDYSHDLSTLYTSPLQQSPPHSEQILDALASHHFLRGDLSSSLEVALFAVTHDSNSYKAFTRLSDTLMKLRRFKSAMLAFGRAYNLSPPNSPVRAYAVKSIGVCSSHCEWGLVMTADEIDEVEATFPLSIQLLLYEPWGFDLCDAITTASESLPTPTLCLESHTRNYVSTYDRKNQPTEKMCQLPRFFRWIIPFYLAASSQPRNYDHVSALASPAIGIKHILTLTENPIPPSYSRGINIDITHLPMDDHTAPTDEQVEIFLRLASSAASTPLLVHCAGGKGRAGTMLACYLMAHGFARPQPPGEWSYPVIPSREAISQLRSIRPGSLETVTQEERVKKFTNRIVARGSPLPPVAPEPDSPFPIIEGNINKPDLLVLVGLPGSGKSWFRQALVARDPSWTYVSGDEDGGTSAVLAAASNNRSNVKLIIDRCNAAPKHRQEILSLAQHATHPVAVFFDVPASLCTDRAQRRTNHPSLKIGAGVVTAMKQFEKILTKPTLKEGFVGVVSVVSFPSSLALVKRIAGTTPLYKFPRTAHLINLGAQTDDDISRPLASFGAEDSGLTMVVTEKIDGANMGFSLNADGKILTQNRSHYVNPHDHVQFKRMGLWVEGHHQALFGILGRDQSYLERYVLFGEWMVAVHSVKYSSLPDFFIAFDLYDRVTRTFVSRDELDSLLRGTGIHATPILYRGPILAERELLRLMKAKSNFSDETMEGVYCKIESEDRVVDRGKIVRADFIAGNEHWSRGDIRFNTVVEVNQYT